MTNKLIQDRFLTRKEAADYLNTKTATLAEWASRMKCGPPFFKVGRQARYRLSDLESWLASKMVSFDVDDDSPRA